MSPETNKTVAYDLNGEVSYIIEWESGYQPGKRSLLERLKRRLRALVGVQ